MRKNSFVTLLIIFIILCITKSYALSFVQDQLKKVKIVEFGKPFHAYTYEDIDGPTIKFDFGGCSVPEICLNDIPSSAILATSARSRLSNLVPGAIVVDSAGANFIESNFYLDYGHEGADGWVEDLSPNPMPSQDPGQTGKIYFCVRGQYKVIKDGISASSIDLSPDGVSCECAKHLCSGGASHVHDSSRSKNVIKNLKDRVSENKVAEEGISLEGSSSEVYQIIHFKDRTPPWIDNCENNRFPTIGTHTPIYTGDWFTLDDLLIKENYDSTVNTKISLGVIDKSPESETNWTKFEVWNDGEVQTVYFPQESGRKEGYLNQIVSPPPNYCYGYMRYTIFAQDYGIKSESKKHIVGNLNPGCASIREDDPTHCYGLPSDNQYYADLSTSPSSAKPWPYRENNYNVTLEEQNMMTIKGIKGKDRVHEGYIKISDNDYPNILIKLTSSKYGEEKQIFFPPCITDGELTIIDSPYYKSDKYTGSSNNFPNMSEYNAFVGDPRNILKECNYKEVKNSRKRPYFTIIDLKHTEFMNDSDISTRNRFLNNSDPAFINKHFRLEDQTYSDTDIDGKPNKRLEESGESLLGKRNGTWKEVVALVEDLEDSEVVIQEDVEYQLSVWVDDSVKWLNSYKDEDNENNCENIIKHIPTGIVDGKIIVDIPNQSPNYHKEYELPKSGSLSTVNQSIYDSVKVVFREPTPDIDSSKKITEEELIEKRLPSITVQATDYSGLTRTIKLYFKVRDENAQIKTLQRRHQQY